MLVEGVGINDADYIVTIRQELPKLNGKRRQKILWRCPYYAKWTAMLYRCYSKTWLHEQPSYLGCSVCTEWIYFSNFKSWMETQDWEGKDLDKDLLVYGNKVYSPETCCFVTKEVNSFLTKRQNHRGNYPIGVNKHYSGFYYARISSKNRTMKHLGSFNNPLKAHRAWQLSKIKRTKELIETQTDNLIVEGLYRVYYKIIADFIDYKETIDY